MKLERVNRPDVVEYAASITVLQHGDPRNIVASVYWDDQPGVTPGWAYSFSKVSRGGPLEGPGEKPISKRAGPKRLARALLKALEWEGLTLMARRRG